MSKLKVGIIGVGGIARTHIPGWQASKEAELVAGSDIGAEALQRFGAEHGVTKLHADPEALLSDPDIDIRRASTCSARSRWRRRPKISAG